MAQKTIALKGNGIRKEAKVGASVITPGYLVELDSAGLAIPHGTALGTASPSFALENELFGYDIDVDYPVGDQLLYETFWSGQEVYALVAASAVAIVIGDFLDSAGDGTLKLVTTAAATADISRNSVVARALEAVDNSGGGSEARIRVEII